MSELGASSWERLQGWLQLPSPGHFLVVQPPPRSEHNGTRGPSGSGPTYETPLMGNIFSGEAERFDLLIFGQIYIVAWGVLHPVLLPILFPPTGSKLRVRSAPVCFLYIFSFPLPIHKAFARYICLSVFFPEDRSDTHRNRVLAGYVGIYWDFMCQPIVGLGMALPLSAWQWDRLCVMWITVPRFLKRKLLAFHFHCFLVPKICTLMWPWLSF